MASFGEGVLSRKCKVLVSCEIVRANRVRDENSDRVFLLGGKYLRENQNFSSRSNLLAVTKRC